MSASIDPNQLEWISGRPVPLDHDGPLEVPLEPLPEAWFRQSLIESFAEVARRHPGHVAVNDGRLRLTFDALRRSADDLVARIHDVAPADRPVVAIVPNDATFPIMFLAAMGLARPVVILAAGEPIERQASILAEVQPGAMVVPVGLDVDPSLVPAGMPLVSIDAASPGVLPRPAIDVDLDQPLSIIFTSGSTGKPRAVVRTQRQVQALVATEMAFLHLNRGDVILGLGSPSHAGVWGPLASFFSGATLRLHDLKTGSLEAGLRVLAEEQVNVLIFVPSALRVLMKIPGIEQAFRSLRVLALGSERTNVADIALFRSRLPPGCKIAIILGSVDCSNLFRWYVPDAHIQGAVPIGYLEPGKSVALVGEDGRSVPPGEPGELYVRGRQLAIGSWQGGRLTWGDYLPDPDDPQSRIFRSKDVVRQRPDGLFDFVGRADQMVKIRGYRVDLGEVEAALRAIEGVADAAAIVRARDGHADQLCAFVTKAPGGNLPSESAMRRRVGQRTAEYMIPAEIRVVDAIPRLFNHKLDLVQLRERAEEAKPGAALS